LLVGESSGAWAGAWRCSSCALRRRLGLRDEDRRRIHHRASQRRHPISRGSKLCPGDPHGSALLADPRLAAEAPSTSLLRRARSCGWGALFIRPGDTDFTLLDPLLLAVVMFILLPGLHGIVVATLIERFLPRSETGPLWISWVLGSRGGRDVTSPSSSSMATVEPHRHRAGSGHCPLLEAIKD
jgi:hypothetical protein